MSTVSDPACFTAKQGQYLAFIYMYALINGRPPAEADLQRFFGVTPPSVHNMIVELERRGLIRRVPRQPRSIEVLVPAEDLPRLQPIKTTVAGYYIDWLFTIDRARDKLGAAYPVPSTTTRQRARAAA